MTETLNDFSKLSERMRADWDRRIAHDYRFWMSDGYQDDAQMWETGRRDLEILLEGVTLPPQATALELGCGVGRLLRHACTLFHRVTGVDVSARAVEKARELLGDQAGLELVRGNGYDLSSVPTESIDVVYSFAAITSTPTDVIANYLREIHRVLKPNGLARLQLYTGEEQLVARNDTLHLRCFKADNVCQAVREAGFAVEWLKELKLPFQVSFKEIGIEASIISLCKEPRQPASQADIARALLPQGENTSATEAQMSEVEYWMSLNYAKTLIEKGDVEKAKETLEFALAHATTTTLDVQDLLHGISTEIARREAKQQEAAHDNGIPLAQHSNDALERNLRALKDLYPKAYEHVSGFLVEQSQDLQVNQTADGPILVYRGQCLDHPHKPKSAGAAWAKRVLLEKRMHDAKQIVVFGSGAGYHIEELLKQTDKRVALIEPEVPVFVAALQQRDLTALFPKLSGLSVGAEQQMEFLDQYSELAIRPQTQVSSAEYCGFVKSLFYGTRGFSSLRPKIGILGPMQGGTITTAACTSRGLLSLGQRIRELDMSGFASAYHQLEAFSADKMRQSVMQGTYVEMLSQVVLESLNEKPVDILICMAQAPISGRVLQELRRQGVITVLWFVEDYLRFSYWKQSAQYYDFIFTIQKGECLKLIKDAGAGEVHYLPVGCDPIVHRPIQLPPDEKARWGSPISFVGAGYHNRQQVFASFAEMPIKLWGTEWPDCRPFDRMVQENGRRLATDEYVKIFNATDININLHSSSERDGVDPFGDFVNPRTFELASCGAFQLVDERSLLPEVFEPGKEVITFNSTADLKAKVDYYLAHPEERRAIAERSRERVLREHTYAHRLRDMLSIIYSSRFETLQRREDASPWRRVLTRAKKHSELHERCQAAFERGEEANLDGLVSDIVNGKGKLSDTEQKLLFLYHIRKQIIRMKREEGEPI